MGCGEPCGEFPEWETKWVECNARTVERRKDAPPVWPYESFRHSYNNFLVTSQDLIKLNLCIDSLDDASVAKYRKF